MSDGKPAKSHCAPRAEGTARTCVPKAVPPEFVRDAARLTALSARWHPPQSRTPPDWYTADSLPTGYTVDIQTESFKMPVSVKVQQQQQIQEGTFQRFLVAGTAPRTNVTINHGRVVVYNGREINAITRKCRLRLQVGRSKVAQHFEIRVCAIRSGGRMLHHLEN